MTIDNYEDKLNIIPVPALCGLWSYHLQVLNILDTGFDTDFSKSKVYQSLTNLHCVASVEISESSGAQIPLWPHRYLDSVLDDPAHLDLTTFLLALSSHVSSTGTDAGTGTSPDRCKHCVSIPGKVLCEFWTALTAFVHESIKKVGMLLNRTHHKSHLIHMRNRRSRSHKAKQTFKVQLM
ncbi:hypothetical protein EDB87DRAFT_941685 [Lactarius vividus]|nr:hypothetical protein EDB87DRAFT_941685 [Lactarius vividus]